MKDNKLNACLSGEKHAGRGKKDIKKHLKDEIMKRAGDHIVANECADCGKVFPTDIKLKYHIKMVHWQTKDSFKKENMQTMLKEKIKTDEYKDPQLKDVNIKEKDNMMVKEEKIKSKSTDIEHETEDYHQLNDENIKEQDNITVKDEKIVSKSTDSEQETGDNPQLKDAGIDEQENMLVKDEKIKSKSTDSERETEGDKEISANAKTCKLCGKNIKFKWMKNHIALHDFSSTMEMGNIMVSQDKSTASCMHCEKEFSSKIRAKIHFVKCHYSTFLEEKIKTDKDQPTVISQKTKRRTQNISDAMLESEDGTILICLHCGLEFSETTLLETHIISVHASLMTEPKIKSSKIHICNICQYSSKKSSRVKDHMASHKPCPMDMSVHVKINSNAVHHCNICGNGFKKSSQLESHKPCPKDKSVIDYIEQPNDGFGVICKQCDKLFATTTTVKHHIRMIHQGHYAKLTEDPSWKVKCICGDCGKGFPDPYQLKRHVFTHSGSKPYKCTQCDKYFTAMGSQRSHIKDVHQQIKNVTCEECGLAMFNRTRLNAHIRQEHSEGPRERKFVCSYANCDRSYFGKNGLERHTLDHTGERPYSCDKCGATFKQRPAMASHILIHSGEKPYICTECGDLFRQRSQLTIHFRRHTGDKPYPCIKCGKSFRQTGTLSTHLRKIHNA